MSIFDQMKNKAQSQFKTAVRSSMQNMGNQKEAFTFADVKADAYYADAVLWAVKEDVTKGTTATTFSPDANCTRAQIVTFIWRCKK